MFSTNRTLSCLWMLAAAVLVAGTGAQAQTLGGMGISTHNGFVYAHSEQVKNTSGARPFMFQLEFDNQFTDSQTWDKCGCMPHHGLLLNHTDFGLPLLGKGMAVAYYLQPSWFVGRHFEVGYRATTGMAVNSNPYDAVNNPENQSYSSTFNVYLALGLHASVRLTSHLNFTGSVQMNHISNGGLVKPNKGVNWPTAGVGLFYRFDELVIPSYKGHVIPADHKSWRYDMAVYYSNPMISQVQTEGYPVSGTQVQGSYVGRLHGWTIGGEFTKDRSYVIMAEQSGESQSKPYLVGALAGHEFILGDFIFSQQLGYYLYKYSNYYPSFYHRWGIVYFATQNVGLGVNLKVHRETANFVDIRVVYSLNR